MENPQTVFVCGFLYNENIMCLTNVIIYDNVVINKGSD